ncbi:7237_t:CDS:2, partial [Gigaspora rosea]
MPYLGLAIRDANVTVKPVALIYGLKEFPNREFAEFATFRKNNSFMKKNEK